MINERDNNLDIDQDFLSTNLTNHWTRPRIYNRIQFRDFLRITFYALRITYHALLSTLIYSNASGKLA